MYRVNFLGKSAINFLILVLCPGAIGAQALSCQHRALPIALRDEQNLPIKGISTADLKATIKGSSVKILSLAPDSRPHRVVLILDASASMGAVTERSDSTLFALELELARHFFDVNHQGSQIALLIFGKRANEVVDFAGGNSAVGDKLRQIARDPNYVKANVKVRTALFDAILEGLQLLDSPSFADALYVLSDGAENDSHRTAADVTRRLGVSSVRLFAVLVPHQEVFRKPNSDEVNGQEALSKIARQSGGEILSTATWGGKQIALTADPEAKVNLPETLTRLYQAILENNLMEIELSFPITKNEHWELNFSETASRKWKGAQITYPTTLISCNSQ